MSPETQRLQNHLDALTAFMESPAYVGYISASEEEVRLVEARILLTPPITDEQQALCLMAHGELDVKKENLKIFEVARVELKARVDKSIELDNQNATETKV